MRRTILIVLAVLVPVSVIGIGLAKRLMTLPVARSSARAAAEAGSVPEAFTSGEGVTLKFSDHPLDVPALSVKDLDGHEISKADWQGKVVLINFWATWCGPCVTEIPTLIALQERYRDRLLIIGLSIDVGPPAGVRAFAEQAGINYPVAIVGRDVQAAFGGVSAVPATFVVNPDGGIVQRHVGLLEPTRTEHEVRVLAKLPTAATVTTVKDVGQVLLSNAAFATELPGVDLSTLTAAQKEEALKRLNQNKCTCGCDLTVAQCRINDPTCSTSPGIAKAIVAGVRR